MNRSNTNGDLRLDISKHIHRDQDNQTWYIQDYENDRVSIDYSTKARAYRAWQCGIIMWKNELLR